LIQRLCAFNGKVGINQRVREAKAKLVHDHGRDGVVV
jgi:hypothetical protein